MYKITKNTKQHSYKHEQSLTFTKLAACIGVDRLNVETRQTSVKNFRWDNKISEIDDIDM